MLHKCTTIRHAKVRDSTQPTVKAVDGHAKRQSAQKMGVDILSIDGFECMFPCDG